MSHTFNNTLRHLNPTVKLILIMSTMSVCVAETTEKNVDCLKSNLMHRRYKGLISLIHSVHNIGSWNYTDIHL